MNILWYILWTATLLFTIHKASAGHQVGTCDDIKCEFPFLYNNHTYNKCTTVDNDAAWCVTDQNLFDTDNENRTLPNGTTIGWSYCSAGCEIEHKICKECEARFVFDGKRHFGCTNYRDEYGDPQMNNDLDRDSQEWSWCVTNITEFNDIDWSNSDARSGWEYCSENCTVFRTHFNRT